MSPKLLVSLSSIARFILLVAVTSCHSTSLFEEIPEEVKYTYGPSFWDVRLKVPHGSLGRLTRPG